MCSVAQFSHTGWLHPSLLYCYSISLHAWRAKVLFIPCVCPCNIFWSAMLSSFIIVQLITMNDLKKSRILLAD